jgi:hypothetical protein
VTSPVPKPVRPETRPPTNAPTTMRAGASFKRGDAAAARASVG